MKTRIADVLIVQGDKLLLVQQRKPAAFGLWSYPGGHVELGETPEEAVYREALEELGTKLTNLKLFAVSTHSTSRGDFELNTFMGNISGEISIPEHELMAYGWFNLAEIELMKEKLRAPFILELASQVLF
jgi:8-oxo-dGTP diphosphatase